MKVISHRGNINGVSKEENSPIQIQKALSLGYDVEVDVWYSNNSFFLGHNSPLYKINDEFLLSNSNEIWVHAKNIEAAERLALLGVHWFWHETDKFTLTSKGIPWCYPNVYVKNGIAVFFDECLTAPDYIFGVCTDYPELWNHKLK